MVSMMASTLAAHPCPFQLKRIRMINVLIVDDNKFITQAMQNILEELDFNVVGVAHDGLQGIERFMEVWPDVTLLDITMPNMDGVECLSKIIEMNSTARVVMLSAVQDQNTISKCLASGASGFLQKPIRKGNAEDLDRLSQALEQATGKTA
jgi:two-component system, chemotaxis family, chemotaxis protein CheY